MTHRSPEEDRLRIAEALLAAGRRVAAEQSLDKMLEVLVELGNELLEVERTTVFLHDPKTAELYARIAHGGPPVNIRILDTEGIAGHVFQVGKGVVIADAYADDRFNKEVDRQTGFKTRNLITVPIRNARDQTIGVVQSLNKKGGDFTERDVTFLEGLTRQASVALQGAQTIEEMRESTRRELEFLDVVAEITSEIDLGTVLGKVMKETTRLLDAERSTLFLNDERKRELWSQVGQGLESMEIRFPNHLGIAGAVFSSGQSVNIPHAYADLRFNPSVDRKTGFFTRSILCTPVVNKDGKIIGVTQVLNKRGGPFSAADESRLRAFTAQISIALENAKLFNDVQSMRNYNESMLESMSNGVLTLGESGRIATCNAAGLRILGVSRAEIEGKPAAEFFAGANAWIVEWIGQVAAHRQARTLVDAELRWGDRLLSANLGVSPLTSGDGQALGTMLLIEDISAEKRMKSTMSRYMDPGLADQLLAGGEDILGGRDVTATVLFSDVRSFTSITEALGAQGTVSLLNEYFTLMVDLIQREGGMLDKFIGDALMAAFGIPVPHEDDEDRAVRTAIAMIRELSKWNEAREAKGMRGLDIGIGLSTDQVVSGNIGSPKRMDYTVMGDGVNLAARLETACKQYHAHILISENTYRKLRGTYRIRDVDDVVVKGKTKPVTIYEVLDYHTPETFPNVMEALNHFKEGRHHYRAGDWDRATRSFNEVLGLAPGDALARTYMDRCVHLKANPPMDEWHGVWVMTSK